MTECQNRLQKCWKSENTITTSRPWYVCMYVCMYVCRYVDMYMCVFTHIHIHKHTNTMTGYRDRLQKSWKSENVITPSRPCLLHVPRTHTHPCSYAYYIHVFTHIHTHLITTHKHWPYPIAYTLHVFHYT